MKLTRTKALGITIASIIAAPLIYGTLMNNHNIASKQRDLYQAKVDSLDNLIQYRQDQFTQQASPNCTGCISNRQKEELSDLITLRNQYLDSAKQYK